MARMQNKAIFRPTKDSKGNMNNQFSDQGRAVAFLNSDFSKAFDTVSYHPSWELWMEWVDYKMC